MSSSTVAQRESAESLMSDHELKQLDMDTLDALHQLEETGWQFTREENAWSASHAERDWQTEPSMDISVVIEEAQGIQVGQRMTSVGDVLSGMADSVGALEGEESDSEQDALTAALVPEVITEAHQLAFSFDYSRLDTETRIVVKQATVEIRDRTATMKRSAVEIGERLLTVKEHLPHGQFGQWLEAEFGWKDRTAENMMNLARFVRENRNVFEYEELFGQTALYLLAAKSTPRAAQEEAIARAGQGEKIDTAVAREIVQKHKSTAVRSDVPVRADDRTIARLVETLMASPDGMREDALLDQGFGLHVIEDARQRRYIERHVNGRIFYAWKAADIVAAVKSKGALTLLELEDMGCQIIAVRSAEQDGYIETKEGGSAFEVTSKGEELLSSAKPLNTDGEREETTPVEASDEAADTHTATSEEAPAAPSTQAVGRATGASPSTKTDAPAKEASIEDLIKGQRVSVIFTFGIPGLKGQAQVSVNASKDPGDALRDVLAIEQIHLPEPVLIMIKERASSVKASPARAAGASAASPSKKKSPGKGRSTSSKKPASQAKPSTGKKGAPKGSKRTATKSPGKGKQQHK